MYGVGLPSKWSSEHSLADAEDSRERLGLHYSVVPIAPIVEAYETSVELSGVAAENLQARVRGTLLMGLSNQHGHLLLTTGNKSEVAVGYSTLYGDSAGGFAPDQGRAEDAGLGAGPLAQRRGPPPRRDRADPAELHRQAAVGRARPGQQDSDSLPPYEELDASSPTTSTATSAWPSCSSAATTPRWSPGCCGWSTSPSSSAASPPPGTKITLKAFGRDRRLPITNRWRETLPTIREGAAHD